MSQENVSSRRNNVLIITGDPLGEKMAGPAIRALNFAEQIAKVCTVRLVTTNICELQRDDFEIARATKHKDISAHEDWANVIVVQGNILSVFPKLQKTKKYLVCDLYDPMQLEQLEQGKDPSLAVWNNHIAAANHLLVTQLRLGDFFLAASERQRDFWLGALATLSRINGGVYNADNTLENFIALAPFGLPDAPPIQSAEPLRGVIDGIDEDDRVIIWAGGIYNWFDPETLVEAVGVLSRNHPEVKLFFMGTQHPHPGVPEMEVLNRTRQLADELALTNRHVFFNTDWVPYNERQNYLLTADIGVSTHFDHVETRFSFRTRILDYMWAGLPIVTTQGDSFAELVAQKGLGIVVGECDAQKLVTALETILFDEKIASQCRSNVRLESREFQWSKTSETLVHYCRNPRYAPDRTYSSRSGKLRRVPLFVSKESFWNRLKNRMVLYYLTWKRLGFGGIMLKFNEKVQRKIFAEPS